MEFSDTLLSQIFKRVKRERKVKLKTFSYGQGVFSFEKLFLHQGVFKCYFYPKRESDYFRFCEPKLMALQSFDFSFRNEEELKENLEFHCSLLCNQHGAHLPSELCPLSLKSSKLEICSICMLEMPIESFTETSCGHFFCFECLNKWAEVEQAKRARQFEDMFNRQYNFVLERAFHNHDCFKCPMCRSKLSKCPSCSFLEAFCECNQDLDDEQIEIN